MHHLPVCCLSFVLLLSGCKKEDDASATPMTGSPAFVFGQPIPGIFTWMEDANTMGYLETDDLGGFVSKGYTTSNYSMDALAEEANCRIEMIANDLDDGPIIYGIHMPATDDWWVPIAQGSDLALKQVDLGMDSLPDFGGYWCWIRHEVGTVNGYRVFAMESYTHPGMYWSTQGTFTGADLIKLTPHQDPSGAQGFIVR